MYVAPNERTFAEMQRWNKIIGKTYFQKNENNVNEYRTIYMRFNPFANKITPAISNFVTGIPPEGMEEINPRMLSALATMQPTQPDFFWFVSEIAV